MNINCNSDSHVGIEIIIATVIWDRNCNSDSHLGIEIVMVTVMYEYKL